MVADDVNLHDVEDFSCDDVTHDQLPSVAEARATIPSKPIKSKTKMWYMTAGLLALTVFIIAIAVPASKKPKMGSEEIGNNVERAINNVALNGKSDFEDEKSYRSLAKRAMVKDPLVEDYTYDQLQQRYALYSLYYATQPTLWNESHGWKRKGVSECHWYGVSCDPTTNMVVRVNLRQNGLQGTIPPEVSLIPKLAVFNVNANSNLTGVVPDNLCDLKAERGLEIKVDCHLVSCTCCDSCSQARQGD